MFPCFFFFFVLGEQRSSMEHGLTNAEREERVWLEAKFQRSGAPDPPEGALTVIIEYCFNSGEPFRQLSTKHGQRYHEEAELVRRYFINYHSGATVFVTASDFRMTKGFRGVRLGAFEVDVRLRVNGNLTTYNLWSKLHTGRWPQWPEWQDAVRQLIPIFHMRLRPAALRSDGAVHFLRGALVQVLNHNGSLVADQALPASGEAGGLGVLVRLLRGTYRVRVAQGDEDAYYPEEAPLTLTKVPLPRSSGPIELRVPMRAKPRLAVVLLGEFDADASLNLVCAR